MAQEILHLSRVWGSVLVPFYSPVFPGHGHWVVLALPFLRVVSLFACLGGPGKVTIDCAGLAPRTELLEKNPDNVL